MKLWTGIVTKKVQESKDFYTRLFGCQVIFESDWFVLLRLGNSDLGFMLPDLQFQPPIFRPALAGQGIWIAIDVDDVASEYERVAALGIPIEVELRSEAWGDRHFAVLDPNGIGIDVVEHHQPG